VTGPARGGSGVGVGEPEVGAEDLVYLAAVKEQNGAAMSLGRTSTFLDVYLERDLAEGWIDEVRAQELVDGFVVKLRIVRFLRTPEYGELFSGDSTWVTESIGGIGDDTAIACCVSAMAVGGQMQFFGARVDLAKALLYAVNGGRDEMTGEQVGPELPPLTGEYLEYGELRAAYDRMLDWLAETYVDALNVIHYMHDKYAYERIEMALHDHPVLRTMACGIAGLSVAADSLSAVRHARVRVVRDATGLAVDYEVEGEYPAYGNNDDQADAIAVELVRSFMAKVRRRPAYRDAVHTQSVLTITSNMVHGKHTGNTPDGRRAGAPFAPGANPMNGRDRHGMAASALSVAKIPYGEARDGISLTSTVTPEGLGRAPGERVANLVGLLDAYNASGGFHLNVNVLDRATLEDAVEHPEKYPDLTIRVSGYAVNFVRLTREQQRDVINRTFHGAL
jgi:formate C-acetyltransferase